MSAPVVLAVGAGGAGAAILEWSMTERLRPIRYALVDSDRQTLFRSRIAQAVDIGQPVNSNGSASDPPEPTRIAIDGLLEGVDICIVVAGLGGASAIRSLLAVAVAARKRGIPCVCIAVMPAEFEPQQCRTRARRTLQALGSICSSLFIVPLGLLALHSADESKADQRTRDLYAYIDHILHLASAPSAVNVLLRSFDRRLQARAVLGLYRRFLLPELDDLVEALIERVNSDPWIIDEQFVNASNALLVLHSRGRPSASTLAQTTYALTSILGAGAALDLSSRSNPDCTANIGLELVTFCPAPDSLAERVIDLPDAAIWQPLMAWPEDKDSEPPSLAYVGLFGSRLTTHDGAAIAAESAVGRKRYELFRWGLTQQGQTTHIPEGGFVAWLDQLLSQSETAVSRVTTGLADAFRAWRLEHFGWRDGLDRAVKSLRTTWKTRRDSIFWNRRTALCVAMFLVGPIVVAEIAVANMQSFARTSRISSGSSILPVKEFQRADVFRITAASKPTAATYGRYDTMGLAAVQPSAQISHLDLWAASEDYLNLHEFRAQVPPFAYVKVNHSNMKGQVGIVGQYLKEATPAPAKAMSALGLFPEVTSLAELTGMAKDDAAKELYEIFVPAGPGGKLATVFNLAGCRTLRDALALHLSWKRASPVKVDLTDRHYLLALALAEPDACRRGPDQTIAASDLLERFAQIAYVRRDGPEPGYDIVVDHDLADIVTFPGNMGVYLSGLRAFYLLDFARAEAEFEQLARSQDAVAATLGAYLLARNAFWHHEFQRGSYRPDQFPPWRHLSGDPEASDLGENPGSEINDEARRLIRERKLRDCSARPIPQEDPETLCRLSTLSQPTKEIRSPLPAPIEQRLRAILARIEQYPIINPLIIEAYLDPPRLADKDESDEKEPE